MERITFRRLLFACILVGLSLGLWARHVAHRRDLFCDFGSADRYVGEQMAHETAKLINGQGDVLVVSMAGGKLKSVVAEAQMAGFRKGLLAHPGMKIVALGMPSQTNSMAFYDSVPEQFIRDSIQAHPTTKAVVSFLGVPIPNADATNATLPAMPKVLALHFEPESRWTNAVASGLVSVVIVARYDVQWNKLSKTKDRQAIFQTRYEVVTKTNLQAVVARRQAFLRAQAGL